MTKKPPIPSIAQAKLIAHLWASGSKINIGSYVMPTHLTCVKRGWLIPNGETGLFPNETEYKVHVLSESALDALEEFLREVRYKRTKANPSPSL